MNTYAQRLAADTITLERLLPGPIERVWDYLTDSDKRARWLAAGPMELRTGGRVEHVFHNQQLSRADDCAPPQYAGAEGFCLQGEITACQPPNLLSYLWNTAAGEPSEVCFELQTQAQQVRLKVTHRRLANRTEMLSVAGGWHTHIAILEAILTEQAAPSFWETHQQLEAEYDRLLR